MYVTVSLIRYRVSVYPRRVSTPTTQSSSARCVSFGTGGGPEDGGNVGSATTPTPSKMARRSEPRSASSGDVAHLGSGSKLPPVRDDYRRKTSRRAVEMTILDFLACLGVYSVSVNVDANVHESGCKLLDTRRYREY